MSPDPRCVVWFRRDLRLADNTALAAAVARGGAVVPLFVIDPALMRGRDRRREAWLLSTLRALQSDLRRAGTGLVLRRGDPAREVAAVAREAGADAVYWNRDYTPYARRRDAGVERACGGEGVRTESFADAVIVEPDALRTRAGRPYLMFAPYYRAWAAVDPRPPSATVLPPAARGLPRSEPLPDLPDRRPLPAPGAEAAQAALERFIATGLDRYKDRRDRLDEDGTSRLSVYLRVGAISPRQIVAAVAGAPRSRARESAAAFVRELAWREFFVQLLWHAPESRSRELRPDRRHIAWRDDPDGLAAWQEGRTGYPIVDAGMRELRATGWMHNRARLVTASFLTKHLLVDWRAGERWFMRELLDGDPAVNGGNWQWVASTATDAMPAFRIFNPVTQGKKFDPTGAYVRRWVPELAGAPAEHLHAPWVAGGAGGYPPPIVDHGEARRRALRALAGG